MTKVRGKLAIISISWFRLCRVGSIHKFPLFLPRRLGGEDQTKSSVVGSSVDMGIGTGPWGPIKLLLHLKYYNCKNWFLFILIFLMKNKYFF